ncbi:MAG: HEAT repeat domain-containing protein [Candidatus Latescibacterota bacterium]|nr:HEAT repeat domain-containing protein [Candidatus Latescibacterota bacterium]
MRERHSSFRAGDQARFVRDGYTVVRSGLPAEFHEAVYAKVDEVFEKESNLGNNILPRVPEIQQVFDEAAVRNALTSLLGPDYILNPHRHCHLNPPGSKGQSWHKDCYVFDHNIRHPRFRWVLAFYYPQETTREMGPTGIMPGQQWYRTISEPDPARATETEMPLVGEAGTIAIVHFDAWHRATPNVSDRKRYMLKFQFARRREPLPSNGAPSDKTNAKTALCTDVMQWLTGVDELLPGPDANGVVAGYVDELSSSDPVERARAADALALSGDAGGAADRLKLLLRDDVERVRVNAAYALATTGADGVNALVASMSEEALANIDLTEAKTADNAHGTNPTAPAASHALAVAGDQAVTALEESLGDEEWYVRASAADGLANMGRVAASATESLAVAVEDEHWWVRRNAIEALSRTGELSPLATTAVSRALEDDDYRVRRNAAMAMRHAPAPAEETITGLCSMLDDENRYNRFYAVDGLRHFSGDSPEAEQALLDHLITARWCPLTSSESQY